MTRPTQEQAPTKAEVFAKVAPILATGIKRAEAAARAQGLEAVNATPPSTGLGSATVDVAPAATGRRAAGGVAFSAARPAGRGTALPTTPPGEGGEHVQGDDVSLAADKSRPKSIAVARG